MLFKSPLLSSASGAVAGLVASHNRYGLYFRARTVPTDPSTAQQTIVRAAMSDLTARWGSSLTQVQRDAWETYASNVTVSNPLGDPVYLTGLNHFCRSNVPRIQAGVARVDDAPTTFNLGDFTPASYAAAETADAVSVTYDDADAWADETGSYLLCYASNVKAPTINFFKGPYRYMDKVAGVTGTPPAPPAAMTSPFALTEGLKQFYQARISRADGRLTAPFRAFDTIAA